MVNSAASPISEQDIKFVKLEKALATLAQLPPKTKIHILDKENFEIVPETRYWITRGLFGWWNGDGCKPTIELVCRIMEECLSLAALIDDSSEDALKKRKERLKQLFPGALAAMQQICDLYGSPKEKEYDAAHGFAIKINVYITGVSGLVDQGSRKSLPSPAEPCEIPHLSLAVPKTIISSFAIPIIVFFCGSVTIVVQAKNVIEFAAQVIECTDISGIQYVFLPGLSTTSKLIAYCAMAKSAIEMAGRAINYVYVQHPKVRLLFKAVQVVEDF